MVFLFVMMRFVVSMMVAGIVGMVLAVFVAVFTSNVPKGRGAAIIVAFVFPLLCVGWFLVASIGQGAINETFFHRDSGFSDSWYAPLPNGYAVGFIDEFDYGTLYDPVIAERDHATADGQEGTINDVRTAQIVGSRILGCAGGGSFGKWSKPPYCFVLDTRTHRRSDFANEEALSKKVAKDGIRLELKPVSDLYAEYGSGWFDVVVLVLQLVVPLATFVLLCRWIVRLRRRRPTQLAGQN